MRQVFGVEITRVKKAPCQRQKWQNKWLGGLLGGLNEKVDAKGDIRQNQRHKGYKSGRPYLYIISFRYATRATGIWSRYLAVRWLYHATLTQPRTCYRTRQCGDGFWVTLKLRDDTGQSA